MASGFIVLPDGRCFSRRWAAHDVVVKFVAWAMEDESSAPLREWLLEQLPGAEDVEELGYGAWRRRSDGEVLSRHIDVRQMTPANQRLFCQAVVRANDDAKMLREVLGTQEWLVELCTLVGDLAEMVERYERGEPALSRSDWTSVPPPEGNHIGPGWV